MSHRSIITVFWITLFLAKPLSTHSQVRSIVMHYNAELKEIYDQANLTKLNIKIDSILSSSSIEHQLATSLFFKGVMLEDDEKYSTSATFYEDAAKSFLKARKIEGELVSLVQMSLAQFMAGNVSGSQRTLQTVNDNKNIESHPKILIEALELESLLHAKNGNHLESITALKRIIPLLDKYPKGFTTQERIIDQIASNYYSIGIVDSAIYYYQSMVDFQEKNQIPSSLNALSTISDLYLNKGDFENAQVNLLEALRMANEQNDTLFLANLSSQLGRFFMDQKQWNDASPYVKDAIVFSQSIGNIFLGAQNLKNKGIIDYQNGNQKAAEVSFHEAIKYNVDLSNYAEVSEILALMQRFDMQVPKIPELIPELDKMIRLHQEANDKLGIIKNSMVLAQLYFQQRNNTKAKGLLLSIESMAEESSNFPALEQVNKQLSEIYQYEGNKELALKHYKTYHKIYDDLRSKDISERINKLNVEFETERKDQELVTERLINESQKEVIKRKSLQNWLLIAGVVLSLLTAGSIYLFFLKNKQLEKHKYKALQIEKESAVLKSVLKGEESERTRIARELHDGLGTLLATVKMQINGIQNTYPDVTNLGTYLKAETLLDEACTSVREISHDMMPSVIQIEGLDAAVEKLCTTIGAKDNIEVEYIGFQVEKLEDKELEINTYRIVQELLKNILKHADAKEVIVQITNDEGFLEILVEDNGRGFSLEDKYEGIGLKNIKYRVESLKGKLEINSKLGEGSTFEIKLPVSK